MSCSSAQRPRTARGLLSRDATVDEDSLGSWPLPCRSGSRSARRRRPNPAVPLGLCSRSQRPKRHLNLAGRPTRRSDCRPCRSGRPSSIFEVSQWMMVCPKSNGPDVVGSRCPTRPRGVHRVERDENPNAAVPMNHHPAQPDSPNVVGRAPPYVEKPRRCSAREKRPRAPAPMAHSCRLDQRPRCRSVRCSTRRRGFGSCRRRQVSKPSRSSAERLGLDTALERHEPTSRRRVEQRTERHLGRWSKRHDQPLERERVVSFRERDDVAASRRMGERGRRRLGCRAGRDDGSLGRQRLDSRRARHGRTPRGRVGQREQRRLGRWIWGKPSSIGTARSGRPSRAARPTV